MELLIAGIYHFNLKKIRYGMFENIAIEDLDVCINSEVQAEYQRCMYGVHAQITTFPMPLNVNDVGYDYEAVAVSIVFTAGKDLEKSLYNLIQERMVDVVGNKGNKKTKSSFVSSW
jgi:hypothetical protein